MGIMSCMVAILGMDVGEDDEDKRMGGGVWWWGWGG